MRIIVRDIINSELKPLSEMGLQGKKINKVYTILNEDKIYMKFDPVTGKPIEKSLDNLIITHLHTVFVEDKGHDWNIYRDSFKFHAHSSGIGDVVDLLIE